jgi:hypothetical protein
MDEGQEQPGHDLVMPFLSVRSKGGPHDDDAYVAGYEMGILDALLEQQIEPITDRSIHADNRAQADLLAMRYGYVAEFGEVEDGWVSMTVRRAMSEPV